MDIISLIRISLSALVRNKTRALLTTLGIVIGVSAVILLVAIGNGLRAYIEGQFEAIGSNTLYVMPYQATDVDGNYTLASGPPTQILRAFRRQDIQLISRIGYPVTDVIPYIEKYVDVKTTGESTRKYAILSGSNYQNLMTLEFDQGRFFTDQEDLRNKRVIVLGFDAAEDLFDDRDPIGKRVTVGSASYTVVGVVEKQGSGASVGFNMDDLVYLPVSSAQKIFNVDTFDSIAVKVSSVDDLDHAVERIEEELLKRRKADEFSIIEQDQLLGTISNIVGVLTLGVGGIAAISLIVGGIGIMNIMLVSVTERTREIGLRKAVGATPQVILIQFLIESVVLSLLGGGIGVAIGVAGSAGINRFFPATVTPESVALAFGVSAAVGILFGILPARRAAGLSPIEALRYE